MSSPSPSVLAILPATSSSLVHCKGNETKGTTAAAAPASVGSNNKVAIKRDNNYYYYYHHCCCFFLSFLCLRTKPRNRGIRGQAIVRGGGCERRKTQVILDIKKFRDSQAPPRGKKPKERERESIKVKPHRDQFGSLKECRISSFPWPKRTHRQSSKRRNSVFLPKVTNYASPTFNRALSSHHHPHLYNRWRR